jgi:hypothetical protein
MAIELECTAGLATVVANHNSRCRGMARGGPFDREAIVGQALCQAVGGLAGLACTAWHGD